MPVYNGAAYVGAALESILAQSYRDFELLVSDNCSTDGTGDIVRAFDDPRIRYERNEKNLGPVGNANRCLERATGEYVGIFHHDDLMLPGNLEAKVRVLDENPQVGFVHSNMILIDPEGRVVQPHSWSEAARKDSIEPGMTAFRRFLGEVPLGATIFIGTVVARRSCYAALGGFRTELPHCNDTEMWMRMLLFYDLACIGTPLVQYRIHPLSASSAFGDHESIGYLSEHHEAVRLLFENWSERIPAAASLRDDTDRAFASRALELALNAFDRGDDKTGRICMREARKMLPAIWRNAEFWRAAGHRLAGPRLLRQLRATRQFVAGGSH
jgi:glycosyltransferase involved in cell wall biosynthesis